MWLFHGLWPVDTERWTLWACETCGEGHEEHEERWRRLERDGNDKRNLWYFVDDHQGSEADRIRSAGQRDFLDDKNKKSHVSQSITRPSPVKDRSDSACHRP